jgi:hypothetical protein
MIYIIAALLLIILYKIHVDAQHDHPLYVDINVKELCKTAGAHGGEPHSKGCDSLLAEEKKKYNELLLKYEDPEPNSVDFLYHNDDDHPLLGDDKLTFKMLDSGKKNKRAMLNRAMWDKNSFIPYLEEELQNHSESIWWDDETLDNEF